MVRRLDLLGVIHGYNEADCIKNSIECLVNSNHRVHFFDHGSTDNTKEIVLEYASEGVKYHYLNRNKVHFWQGPNNLFTHISKFISTQHPACDWVTWLDADEILIPPEGMEIQAAYTKEFNRGVRVVRTTIHEYWITDKDDPTIENYLDRLQYYRVKPASRAGGINRGWYIPLTGIMPRGKHRKAKDWGKGAKISNWNWILKHYPIRSKEHGVRKIMKERNWVNKQFGSHYNPYKRVKCKNLVKKASSLKKHE